MVEDKLLLPVQQMMEVSLWIQTLSQLLLLKELSDF
jgi:hypothetical protein